MTLNLSAPPSGTSSAVASPEILVVTRTFLPDVGGIEDYVYNRCKQNPDKIAVLSASCRGDRAFDKQQQFPVHRWPVIPLPNIKGLSGFIKQIVYLVWELITTFRLYGRYRYTAIEWCHGYDFPVILLVSYLLPVRCVMYLHGNDMLCPVRNPVLKPLFLWTLNRMDQILCGSSYTQRYLDKHFNVTTPVIVINPTVRPEKFDLPLSETDIESVRKTYGIPTDSTVLLSVGRLVVRKGFDTVIKLMPHLLSQGLDVHYLVCGKGKQQPELRALVAQLNLGDRVHFAGYIPDSALAAHYAASDIFTLPTFFNEAAKSVEGYGIVYAEAGYFGKPVVACDVGGVADAVKHNENGIMVSPDNPR